jgi:hypothetical protein
MLPFPARFRKSSPACQKLRHSDFCWVLAKDPGNWLISHGSGRDARATVARASPPAVAPGKAGPINAMAPIYQTDPLAFLLNTLGRVFGFAFLRWRHSNLSY